MEWLVANLGAVRQAELQGRPHLVAPVTLIVPGVLNGSHGPLFYPADEVARSALAWNHVPIVLEHPEGGSARDPDVLNRQGVGVLLNADVDDRGHLVGEAWFDIAATKRVEPRVLSNLNNSQPGEVSTGLQLDQQPAPAGSTHNGASYELIARNYRPDHLAVFVNDKKGACSVEDGCGLLVNEDGSWDMDAIRKGFAKAYKASAETFAGMMAQNIARTTGATPTTSAHRSSAMDDATRKNIVDSLISNAECCWEEGDREFLMGLDDNQLKRAKARNDAEMQLVANATAEFTDPAGSKHTWKDGKWESATKAPKPQEEPVANQTPPTKEEWMALAPPEIRDAVENAMAIEQRERKQLVGQLTANLEDNDKTTALKNLLGTKSLVELRTMAPLAPESQQSVTNWLGAAAPAAAVPDTSKLPKFGAPADYLPQDD
jgi:hypothetical protein